MPVAAEALFRFSVEMQRAILYSIPQNRAEWSILLLVAFVRINLSNIRITHIYKQTHLIRFSMMAELLFLSLRKF